MWSGPSNRYVFQEVCEYSHCKKIVLFVFVGAKRDAKGVSYLVQSKNNVDVEVITANDAQMFPIQIIEFLESKIVWEDAIEDVNFRANLAGSQNAVSTVVCMYILFLCRQLVLRKSYLNFTVNLIFSDATKRTSGELAYFFQCDNGEILIMSAQEAKVHHPHLVLEFLENSIA